MANQAAYLELSDRRNIYGFKEQMGSKVDMPQAKIKGGLFTPGPSTFIISLFPVFTVHRRAGSAKYFTSPILQLSLPYEFMLEMPLPSPHKQSLSNHPNHQRVTKRRPHPMSS